MRREQSLYVRDTQKKTPGGLSAVCFRNQCDGGRKKDAPSVGVAPDQSLELCKRIREAEIGRQERKGAFDEYGVSAEQVQGSTPEGPPRPGRTGDLALQARRKPGETWSQLGCSSGAKWRTSQRLGLKWGDPWGLLQQSGEIESVYQTHVRIWWARLCSRC